MPGQNDRHLPSLMHVATNNFSASFGNVAA